MPQGLKQLRDRPFLVNRNKTIAHLVCRCMKADGQHTADFLGTACNFWHNATGRKGNAAAAEADPLAVHCDFHRIAHRIEIIERLTHAHQHDI